MKVVLLWNLVLFKLYSIPACVVNTTVPVGTAHVGCVTLATVGCVGAVGTSLMVTFVAAFVVHALSVVLRTLKVYVFGNKPAKVTDDW